MIFRIKHKSNFTTLSNKMLDDKTISFRARGLLAFLLTHPNEWKFYRSEIKIHSDPDGNSAIGSAIKELINAGYLTCQQQKDDNGKWTEMEWNVREKPLPEKPLPEKPLPENRVLLNTDRRINTNLKKRFLKKNDFDPFDLPLHLSKQSGITQAWSEFIQHRKEKKCPLTPLAYKKIIKSMLPHPPEVIIAAINKAISSGWRGLFFPDPSSPRNVMARAGHRETKLPFRELCELGDAVGRPITEQYAEYLAHQVEQYWNQLYEVRNPRNRDQGPTDLISLRKLWMDWLSYLREIDSRFPYRSVKDLEVGQYRWKCFVDRCEQWTGYCFATGKRG